MLPLSIGYIGNFKPAHSTENHVTAALVNLGNEVYGFQENDPDAWTRLSDVIRARTLDLILWTRTGWNPPVPHDVQRAMLALAREHGTPTIGFHLDRWWGLNREPQVKTEPYFEVDVLFTADGGHQPEWESVGITHLWAPPGVLHAETERTPKVRREFRTDIVFVGSHMRYHEEWPHRRALVQWATRTYRNRFAVWPRGGQSIRGQDLTDLYGSARVVLGDSCLTGNAHHYWSDRIPETMGRGGLLLHPYVDGLAEQFPSTWVSLCTWDVGDFDALRRLIDYWTHSDHDVERREMAALCQAWVQERHTYEVRLQEVLAQVKRADVFTPLRDRTGVVTLTREGVTGIFDLREGHYDGIAVEETWRENVYRLHPHDVRGRQVVDIGANVGAFTIWAAKAGAHHVYAYEPHPDIYAALLHNLELNGIGSDQVTTYNEAVGARSGHGYAVLGHSGYDGGSYVTGFDEPTGPADGVEVAATDLAMVLMRTHTTGLVLKVDCEGCEYDIFGPCESTSLRRVGSIVMEFHGPRMENSAHIAGGVSEFGALVSRLAEDGHVEVLGRPSVGGTIWWRQYGS